MNLATLRKLVLGYIVAVPVLIVITIVQFMSVQGVVDAHRRLGNSYDVIRQADALAAALTETDDTVRNFLVTRRHDELGPYEAAPERTKQILAELTRLAQGDEPQQARVKRLESAVATRMEHYRKLLESERLAPPYPSPRGITPPPNEAAVQGEKLATEIAKVISELRLAESNRLPGLAQAAYVRVHRANQMAPIAGVLAIWMVLLAALLLYRDTARRSFAGVERRIQTRVVETLPLGICLVDENGMIIYTNSAQDTLFGYEPGGMVGRHVTAAHSAPRGDGDDLFGQAMEELKNSGSWRGGFVAKRKNSTTFNCVSQAVTMEMSGKMYRLFLMAGGGASPAA